MSEKTHRLGMVVSGSLTKGLEVRLDGATSIEEMAVGRYVTITGGKRSFFGMVTDISLGVTDERIILSPPAPADRFTAEVLSGTGTFGTLHVLPMLTIGGDTGDLIEGPQPVKTVPAHFAEVRLASQQDMELVFGGEDANMFYIGTPLDMETRICLDLPELVKRSNGIFGKSGTGKTFLTRVLLIGMLQKSKAVSLVFDMASEYGWEGSSESKHGKVKGLKQLFPANVAVVTLDEESSKRRKVSADFVVKIGYDEIEPEDIALLRQTLNLTDIGVEGVYQLSRKFGRTWVQKTLEINPDELPEGLNIHESSLQNIQRGLATIQRLPFLVPRSTDNVVQRILEYLDRGINVVLEFGRYTDITAYILVANLLSRRIYDQYRAKTEKAIAEDSPPPHPLVITIEEAHRFLNPATSSQTIFGIIAREMRKYNVTLLSIDQRPSGIDEEVMSQLGTKITCLLDNEKDIDAVLAGVSGRNELKSVLAKLESKQQALIFGHAVPMPVVVKTREYGSAASYNEFASSSPAGPKKAGKDIEELWG